MDNPAKLAIHGTQATRKSQTKQKHNTICVGHHYTQTNTNNVNKTWALLQTTGGKDEPNIVLRGNRKGHHQHGTQNVKIHKSTTQKTKMIGTPNNVKIFGSN